VRELSKVADVEAVGTIIAYEGKILQCFLHRREGSGVRTLLVLRRISSRVDLEFERRTSSRALALEIKCVDQQ
jgi:hypothetical protein